MNRDVRVLRMIAAVSSVLFGSLWLATHVARDVAPPEPLPATILRYVSIVLFFVSAAWGIYLYLEFRKEELRRKRSQNSEDTKEKNA